MTHFQQPSLVQSLWINQIISLLCWFNKRTHWFHVTIMSCCFSHIWGACFCLLLCLTQCTWGWPKLPAVLVTFQLGVLADDRRAQSNLFGGVVYVEMQGYFQWKCHAGSISIPNKIQLPSRPSSPRGCLSVRVSAANMIGNQNKKESHLHSLNVSCIDGICLLPFI